jgi:hypothetical protein
MNGNHYANVFVHFQPVDHEDTQRREVEERNLEAQKKGHAPLFANPFSAKKPIKRKIGGHEQDQHDPSDIQKHLDEIAHEEKHGKKQPVPKINPFLQPKISIDKEFVSKITHPFTSGAKAVTKAVKETLNAETPEEQAALVNEKQFLFDEKLYPRSELLRRVAARGDFVGLARILKEGPAASTSELLLSADENGWQAIHEAVRSGFLDAVRLLVESGADLGSKVAGGFYYFILSLLSPLRVVIITGGGSALWVARNTLADSSEVTSYLLSIGAPDDVTGVEDELDLPAKHIKELLKKEQNEEPEEEEEEFVEQREEEDEPEAEAE